MSLKKFEKENPELVKVFYKLHSLEEKVAKYEKLIQYIENISAPAVKGTVLEMVHRKILMFKKKEL